MTGPNTRRYKILHFMPDNFVWGGIEIYLKDLLPTLKRNDQYDIVAVVTQDSQLYTMLQEQGVKVHGISFPFREKSFIRSLWVNPWGRLVDLSVYGPLTRILKEEQPDLVHVHAGRIEQSLIKRAGFPMVYTYHGYGGPYNIEVARNLYLKYLYLSIRFLFTSLIPYLSGMTVVSDFERKRLYREGFLPQEFEAEVLHNGMPTDRMLKLVEDVDPKAVRDDLGIPQDARVIAFFCRLREDKNAMAMLRIARRVIESNRLTNPVYFIVGGEGKLADTFREAFTTDPVMSPYGQYLGFRNDVLRLITACDFTISTSLQEGFGLRVLESLLMGKPCITFAAGGIPEVMSLPEAQDWLLEPGDEDAFVEALIQAVNMPQEQLEELGPILQAHAQTFDMTHHAQALENFYARTLRKVKGWTQPFPPSIAPPKAPPVTMSAS
jgi:glycosyltransferase EpsD